MSDTFEKVKSVVVEQLGVDADKVQMESDFIKDLGADSLDTVELVMSLEEAFDCEIPDEKAESLKTVKAVCDYIDNELNK